LELDQNSTFHSVVGGNRFSTSTEGESSIITVDDIDLIWVRIEPDGGLYLNLNVFDDCNDFALLIHNNEFAFASSLWDITFEGKTLTLREASRQLLLEITFLPPRTISIDRGRLLCNGVEIFIDPRAIYCNGRLMVGSLAHNCRAGLVVGRNVRGVGAGYHWPKVQRRSDEQRRTHKNAAEKAIADLPASPTLHVATGTERYVSTVGGCEDFHIVDESSPLAEGE
jgi:hypothetical protein